MIIFNDVFSYSYGENVNKKERFLERPEGKREFKRDNNNDSFVAIGLKKNHSKVNRKPKVPNRISSRSIYLLKIHSKSTSAEKIE